MPLTVSGVIVRSADSASVVDVEKPVSENAVDPNARTDTRSAGGLAATNARAAAVAWSSAWPAIDRERSMAITTLFEAPMLVAVSPATGAPFCVKPGGLRRRRRREHRHADARELARVDGLHLPSRVSGRGEDQDGDDCEKRSSHWNPPKLAAVKLGLKFGSSCWKNVAGRVTPLAASLSRK